MSQKNIILLVAVLVSLIIGALVGIVAYYYFFPTGSSPTQGQNGEIERIAAEKAAEEAARKAAQEQLMQETYPDLIKGTLHLSLQKNTIKTEDGKEYWIWPVKPKYDYEQEGLKDGQSIEIRGRIMPKDAKFKEDRVMTML